jgi:hypothetical protein
MNVGDIVGTNLSSVKIHSCEQFIFFTHLTPIFYTVY